MRHTLINFNMPNHLKNNLDMLVKFKRVSRTSILNKIIEEFCRTEFKLIKEDRQINELISSYADNTSTPFVHNDEPINIPMIHDYINHIPFEKLIRGNLFSPTRKYKKRTKN